MSSFNNYEFSMNGENETLFRDAFLLALRGQNHYVKTESEYKIPKEYYYYINKNTLTLYWSNPDLDKNSFGLGKMPYKMDYYAVIDFCWNWLKSAERLESDLDYVKAGWKLTNSRKITEDDDERRHQLHFYHIITVIADWNFYSK